MKILKQKQIINKLDGTQEVVEITHLYSETGYFTKDGLPTGIHIQLGTNGKAEDYTEVKGEEKRIIPASLPDIIIDETPETIKEPETVEEYKETIEDIIKKEVNDD